MEVMRAAVVDAPGSIECRQVPLPPSPGGSGTVLLRTLRASICGSDVHVVDHGVGPLPYPFPAGHPGHESVGEIVESTDGSLPPGTRVLAVPPIPRTAAFAEYQLLTAAEVLALPPGDADALLLGQQLGTVLYALERFWPVEGAATVAVIGAGSAGLLLVDQLRRRGAGRIVVADLEPSRLERARRLGADETVLATERSTVDAVLELTGGHGADLVIEAAGHDATRAQAVHAVAIGGRIGFFGLPERTGDVPFPVEALLRRKPTVVSQHGAQQQPGLASFRRALDAIATGDVEVSSYITHVLPIERIGEALDLARKRADACCKIAISFDP